MTKHTLLAAALCSGCVITSPASLGAGGAPLEAPDESATVPEPVSSQPNVLLHVKVDWTDVDVPHYWQLDLQRGTASYRYFSRVDGTKQYEYQFAWTLPPASIPGQGFVFIYGCSISFVGPNLNGLLVELAATFGMLDVTPQAVVASAVSENQALVADQKMVVVAPMSGLPAGTQAQIQVVPFMGPRIVYTYEYR